MVLLKAVEKNKHYTHRVVTEAEDSGTTLKEQKKKKVNSELMFSEIVSGMQIK
jgi:hypothetical protein